MKCPAQHAKLTEVSAHIHATTNAMCYVETNTTTGLPLLVMFNAEGPYITISLNDDMLTYRSSVLQLGRWTNEGYKTKDHPHYRKVCDRIMQETGLITVPETVNV